MSAISHRTTGEGSLVAATDVGCRAFPSVQLPYTHGNVWFYVVSTNFCGLRAKPQDSAGDSWFSFHFVLLASMSELKGWAFGIFLVTQDLGWSHCASHWRS